MRHSFSLRDLLGFLVSIVLLILVFRNMQLRLFAENYHNMILWPLALSMVLHCVQTVILGKRWTTLFAKAEGDPPVSAVPSYWLGNFYNTILPGRLGDAVRVFHYAAKSSINYKKVLAGMILERYLDVQVIGFFGIVYLTFLPMQIPLINWMIAGLITIIGGLDLLIAISLLDPRILKMAIRLLPKTKLRRWIYIVANTFLDNLKQIFRSRQIILFLLVGCGIYIIGMCCFYLDLKVSGLEHIFGSLSIAISFPIFFMVLHFIPSAPSSAGVVHFGVFKALIVLAKSKGIEVSAFMENQFLFSAAIFHFSLFLPETVIGLFYMVREQDILFDMRKNMRLKK